LKVRQPKVRGDMRAALRHWHEMVKAHLVAPDLLAANVASAAVSLIDLPRVDLLYWPVAR
jgi:hypothetical protein